MELSDEDKEKLNGIIGRMEAAGEGEAQIRQVISEYKAKYGYNEEKGVTETRGPTMIEDMNPGGFKRKSGNQKVQQNENVFDGLVQAIAQPSIDYGNRLQRRADRVQAPTITERLIPPGSGQIEQIAAIPERAVRMAGGAVESLAEIPMGVLETGDAMLGGIPSKTFGGMVKHGAKLVPPEVAQYITEGVDKILTRYKEMPQEYKDTFAPLASLLSVVPVTKMLKKAPKKVKKLAKKGYGAVSGHRGHPMDMRGRIDEAIEMVNEKILKQKPLRYNLVGGRYEPDFESFKPSILDKVLEKIGYEYYH